jgi:hypothetical protein
MPTVPRHEEVKRILAVYNDSEPEVQRLLTMQLTTLHNRAQVLLGLSGVAITTTGFSGRSIAGTGTTAQFLIIAGVSTVLFAAMIVVVGVLQLNWLTQVSGDTLEERLHTMLMYRDRKMLYYRIAIVALIAGLTMYVAAIAIMLANPHANVPPPIYR